jgi:hypothetical protein
MRNSKEQKQKELQGFIEMPAKKTCSHCDNLKESILGKSYYVGDTRCTPILKGIHCGIGGFEVELYSTCNNHTNKKSTLSDASKLNN